MRMKIGWVAVSVFAAMCLAACSSQPPAPVRPAVAQPSHLTLVKDGAATSVIVIAEPACEAAKIGAQELQYHLRKMSGAEVPIITAADAPKGGSSTLILIGRSPLTDALNIDLSKIAPEGYIIKTVGNSLVLIGDEARNPQKALDGQLGDNHGSLFAVYGLLEDQLGCRWIWPGVTGEHVPARATVEVAAQNVIVEPAMKRRHMRNVMSRAAGPSADANLLGDAPLAQLKEDEAVWYRRMRMGRSMGTPPGHSFTKWWEEYKDSDPEVFALLPNGTRGPASAKKPDFVKMCVANPKLWELQIKLFKEAHEKNPNKHDLSCCENDGSAGFCTCDLCKAWDVTVNNLPAGILNTLDEDLANKLVPDENGIPKTRSARYARWFNEMARRVREIDPQGYVAAYAYASYRDIPLTVKLEPNMLIGFIGFNTYPHTPLQGSIDRRNYFGWAQPGVRMYVRPNSPHYTGNGHPYNVARQMGEDFQFCLNHNAIMADFDSMNGYWAAWGPTYYVVPRLMWEGGDAEIEQLLNEWYSAFGPAERQIRAYYDFWEKYIIWVKTAPKGQVRDSIPEIYPQEIIDQARKLLDAATAAAADADESVKAKIENIALCLQNTELSVKAEALASKAKENKDDQETAAALKTALQELLALRRTMAPRNVVNVYKMTDGEMGGGGYWKGSKLPWTLIADVKPTEGPVLID